MLDPKQCVLFSGGAAGTEQFFGAQAEAWGIEEVNYSFDGHQIERKRGVRVLTSEELALKDVSLTYVSRLMGREFTKAPLFRKVLQSICWQVSSGQEVVVVGTTGRFEIWEAARFASGLAALSVQRIGTTPAMPTREEIDAFLAEH